MVELTMNERRVAALRETWAYAKAHSAYYAEILPEVPQQGEELSRLQAVPPLTSNILRDHTDELRCLDGIPAYMLFSGGTTGAPRVIYGARRQLDKQILFEPTIATDTGVKPLGLRIDGGHHGTPPWVPGDINYLQIPLRNRKNYDWMWRLLTSEHHFAGQDTRIRYAMLPLPAAKKLALLMLEHGHDASELALESISTYAWYLSAAWRERLQSTTGARVYDCYGFTEIPTALAHECEICDWYHFSHRVFWEVVSLKREEPVREGIGRVLVTSLYPWTQDHILFRYDPGDLVRVGPVCPLHGERGIRPLGRIQHATLVEDQGRQCVALCPGDVQEVLDCLPDVARFEENRFQGVSRSNDDAFPRWRSVLDTEHDIPLLRLEIEMKWSPKLFRDEWLQFSGLVQRRILEHNSVLESLIDRHVLRLEVAGLLQGELADEDVVIC